MNRAPRLLVFAISLVFASLASAADADPDPLHDAREHLQKGRYAEALEAFDRLEADGANSARIAVDRSRAYAAEGRYDEAGETLSAAVKVVEADKQADDADVAFLLAHLAELQLARGRFGEAEKTVNRALKLDPDQPLARQVLAGVLTETGRIDEANDAWYWAAGYYRRNQPEDAETVLPVAAMVVQYARWNTARASQFFGFAINTLYPDAQKDDPLCWQASYRSGELLLEKYNRPQALSDFKKALAINPRAAEVLTLLGEAALQKHELEKAAEHVSQALEVNPKLPAALRLKADLKLAGGHVAEALQALDAALEVNPHDQRTLARVAVCYVLTDGMVEDDVLDRLLNGLDDVESVDVETSSRFTKLFVNLARRNPKPGEFLSELAKTLEGLRRFKQAERLYRQAIVTMPQNPDAKTGLGMLYMRVGKTGPARAILDDAFKADPYHVRVSNMRKVLRVLESYRSIETEHFVVRFDDERDAVLGRYMSEYLEEIYPQLVARFGYAPKEKTTFEIYNESKGLSAHQWFSARMIGLPWIQTIGATTGKMVALASPNAVKSPYDWARVLRHEYTHVITLEQTNFNIPHWFTEALAVDSEERPRPSEWNALLLKRVPKGELSTLDNLNDGFIRPESSDDWQFAYCQSKLYLDYMRKQYGNETIPKLLEAYRENLPTPKAVPHAFGVELAEFEKGYRKYLDELVRSLSGGRVSKEQSLAELEKAHKTNPDDADAAGDYARALLKLRRTSEARELAESALEKNPKSAPAALVVAALSLRAADVETAAATLEPALDRDNPHPELLAMLAQVRLKTEEFEEAEKLFKLGRRKFPHDATWSKGRAAVALKTGDRSELKSALEDLAHLDGDDPAWARKRAQIALDDGEHEKAVKFGRDALFVDVTNVDVHRILGLANLALKNHEMAAREFEVALELKPDEAGDDVELGLARAYIGLDRKDDARARLNAILARDEDNQDARELLEKLAD